MKKSETMVKWHLKSVKGRVSIVYGEGFPLQITYTYIVTYLPIAAKRRWEGISTFSSQNFRKDLDFLNVNTIIRRIPT